MSSPSKQQSAPQPARQEIPQEWLDRVIERALDEDLGSGDRTCESGVPEAARAYATLVAKSAGRLAGLNVFVRVFEICDPEARIERLAEDGDACAVSQTLARVEGNARALLAAERTALNFMQRMSGIASLTSRYVELCEGRARVLDTRKTTPNLRHLEKHAVLCGGGENHRFGLFDEVMLKENHIDLAGKPLGELLKQVRAEVGDMRITCEARNAEEARTAVSGDADVVMLDNMSCDTMSALVPSLRELAEQRGRPVELEASGGINESTIADVSRTGVDRISVGGLTHSAPALDLSLYLEPIA